MSPLVLVAINLAGFIARMKQQRIDDLLVAQAHEVLDQLTPQLPEPPDGVSWKYADLIAIKAEHDAETAEIRDRHKT